MERPVTLPFKPRMSATTLRLGLVALSLLAGGSGGVFSSLSSLSAEEGAVNMTLYV
jgi:hypothetical protein